MDPTHERPRDTPGALLASAAEVFAAKGYHEATVAEICERAGANVAAVNYYFRSKENLYVESWRDRFERIAAAHPADGGVPADAPAEERLRGRIRGFIARIWDPQNRCFEIVQRELLQPTGLLDEVFERCIKPVHEATIALVAELLGANPPRLTAILCTRSIIAQCLHVLTPERRAGFPKSLAASYDITNMLSVDVLVDHITAFSLAGIRRVRQSLDAEMEAQGA